MIHYHGGPVWPEKAAIKLWKGRHGFVSFYRPEQIEIAAEQCATFGIDNGAYSFWKSGKGKVDVVGYGEFVDRWSRHPAFDWCLIPDVVDGGEDENDAMMDAWEVRANLHRTLSVPVWHLHESLRRLKRLARDYPRIAFGSSGKYAKLRTATWRRRMDEAFAAVCDEEGFPITKLHGLRMLSPTITSLYPFASADSTNVAQNIGIDQKWRGPYAPRSRVTRAMIVADNIEHHPVARRWTPTAGLQHNMELMG